MFPHQCKHHIIEMRRARSSVVHINATQLSNMSSGSLFVSCMMRIGERLLTAQAAERLQQTSQSTTEDTSIALSKPSETEASYTDPLISFSNNINTTNPPRSIQKQKNSQNTLIIAQQMHSLRWMIGTSEPYSPKHHSSKEDQAFLLLFCK